MSAPSPTIEGFRAAFRRPSFTFAEIAWRWACGFSAAALFIFYCVEYLDTLPVTNADSILLSTRQPALVARALAHILRGNLNRAVLAASLAALALSLLWIVAASLGRLATVRALLDHFRRNVVEKENASSEAQAPAKPRPIRALIDLNFLRAAAVLAMILALAGAAILAGFVSSKANPRPGLAFTLFLPLAGLVCIAGWALNWWLSLAGIFAVRHGHKALDALSGAVALFRERTGSVLAVSTWTGLAHLIAFSIATTAISFTFAFIRIVPSRLLIVGIILITLIYFAVADWLYMARLAGYVCIAEMPPALPATSPLAGSTSPARNVPGVEPTIDRDEPILSDEPDLTIDA